MRPRIRHFLIVAALAAVAGAAAPEDLLEPTPISRENVSINLPRNWKERRHESAHMFLVAGPETPDTDPTGDYSPVIIIRSTPRSGPATPIDGDAQQAHVAGEMNHYEVTEKPQQVPINGLDAVTFGGTFTQGALKLRSRQYFIAANEHLYTMTLITLASTWEKRLPAAYGCGGTYVHRLEQK